MTKIEYLNELYSRLSSLPERERAEIMRDYEEHFAAGRENGKTDEQICFDLGTPEMNARQYTDGRPAGNAYFYGQPSQNTQQNESVNKMLWLVLFVLDIVFLAIPGYPFALGLAVTSFAVIILSITAGVFTGSALLGCFLIAVAAACFFAGLLIFLLLTWSLRVCFRRFQG